MSAKTKTYRADDLPEILSPTVDIIFKILFGDERNRDILADFLSAVLGFEISQDDITILDPHLQRDNIDDKLGILDLKLKLVDEKYVNVEMQVGKLKDIHKRVEYYISNTLVRQLGEGNDYENLLPVVAIIIVAEGNMLPKTERFHCEFGTLEKTELFELHDLKTIHTLELPKLPKDVDGKLEDWLKFIKAKKREEYMVVAQKSKPMTRALEVLEEASANQAIRDQYFYRNLAKMDERARIAYARDEGKAEGMAEVFALLEQGLSLDEAKKKLGLK